MRIGERLLGIVPTISSWLCHGHLRPQHYCPDCGAYNPKEE